MTNKPFARRTQFTEQDEQHLCNWIAAKIPYKETGGRTGNRLYQQLCDLVSPKLPANFHIGFTAHSFRAETQNIHGLLVTLGNPGERGIRRMPLVSMP